MSQTSSIDISAIDISAIDIDRIVRDVLASLATANASPTLLTQSALATSLSTAQVSASTVAPSAPASTATHLSSAVLSLDSLRTLAKNTTQITVDLKTLVTPAAKDWLREKGIAWSRASSNQSSATSPTQGEKKLTVSLAKPLFVTGSVLWLRNLEKQLCPKGTLVDQVQVDDAATLRSVAQAIRSGSPSAVAIVKAPHSTLWQAARDEALRPVIVSQWSDLTDVLREVPTNLLIVPATRWNTAGAANIARKFMEHIQANR
jgi:hypothetical protein